MRFASLCLVLFSLSPISFAQSSIEPSAGAVDQAQIGAAERLTPALRAGSMIARRWLSADGKEFCAYIRAYRVKRDATGSDAVHLSGYTTCVPSARADLKSALQVETEPDWKHSGSRP